MGRLGGRAPRRPDERARRAPSSTSASCSTRPSWRSSATTGSGAPTRPRVRSTCGGAGRWSGSGGACSPSGAGTTLLGDGSPLDTRPRATAVEASRPIPDAGRASWRRRVHGVTGTWLHCATCTQRPRADRGPGSEPLRRCSDTWPCGARLRSPDVPPPAGGDLRSHGCGDAGRLRRSDRTACTGLALGVVVRVEPRATTTTTTGRSGEWPRPRSCGRIRADVAAPRGGAGESTPVSSESCGCPVASSARSRSTGPVGAAHPGQHRFGRRSGHEQ